MQKTTLINEIKFLELKLNALKAQVEPEKPEIKTQSSSDLYGILQVSEDITPEDIESIKIDLKELS